MNNLNKLFGLHAVFVVLTLMFIGCDGRVQFDNERLRRETARSVLCRGATQQVCPRCLRGFPQAGSLECAADHHWMHFTDCTLD